MVTEDKMISLFEKYDNTVGNDIVYWGAGATLNIWWNDMLRTGLRPKYIVDKKRCGESFNGIPIRSPNEINKISGFVDMNYIVFSVNAETYLSIKNDIALLGVDKKRIYSCSAIYFHHYKTEVLKLYHMLEDDLSKQHLYSFLESRMEGHIMKTSEIEIERQYFSPYVFSRIDKNEVYVDAGAYAGDTLERFLFHKFGTFGRYYAFEPFERSYLALRSRAERLIKEWALDENKIVIENMALSRKTGKVGMSSELPPICAVVVEDDEVDEKSISSSSIDDYFKDIHISTIKADIEGSEQAMLLGARAVILRDKPKMALSVYHLPSDIIELPKIINSIREDYHFMLRCHIEDGEDTVLYVY